MPMRWTTGLDNSSGHSPIEIERRLTEQRLSHEHLRDDHAELQESHEALEGRLEVMSRRMSLHEKAILAILGLLQVVLQDKYPVLAALLKSLTP